MPSTGKTWREIESLPRQPMEGPRDYFTFFNDVGLDSPGKLDVKLKG